MAAPSPTPRVTPTANMLENGYQSLITLAADTDIELWEKSVTPPAIDGGDPIDITTQHNEDVVTMHPNALYTVADGQSVVAYSRNAYTSIIAIINVLTTITYRFPDGGTIAVFGFLRSFTPNEMVRGSQPEATIVIVHSNLDPSDKSEQAMVISAAVGTP
jgi:hypothetical protein